jgi:hypothetical protein
MGPTILSSSIVGPFSSFKVVTMANRFGGISGFAFDADGNRLAQVDSGIDASESATAADIKAATMVCLMASKEWAAASALGF